MIEGAKMGGPISLRSMGLFALLATSGVLSMLAGCAAPPSPQPGLAPPAVYCADFSFPIYFETGSEQLTAAARQEIGYTTQRVRGCRINSVAVIGLADADGPARRNLLLSRRRAATVASALSAAGLPAPNFDIEALGEQGAITAEGKEPLRRRTEVVIHASAPPPTR
jgi:outer membrane protein OmpA-like peptidoglycan-associated protein